jgi:hypothetical protein
MNVKKQICNSLFFNFNHRKNVHSSIISLCHPVFSYEGFIDDTAWPKNFFEICE